MRRLLVALLVVVVLAVAGLLAVPFLISDDMLRGRLAEQIASVTGRDVSLGGEPVVRFFPEIRVTVNDIAIAGPPEMVDADVLTMKSLTGIVRLLPLIIGRVEFRSFNLEQPVVRLIRDKENRRNWHFDSGAAALQLAFSGDVLLGRFELSDGMVIYEDRSEGKLERFENLNLIASWPSIRNPVTLDGSLTWNGEAMTIEAAIDNPFDLIRGRPTPARANLTSSPLTVAFDGQAFKLEPAELSGAFDIAMPSLRRFSEWIGADMPDGPVLGQTRLAGTARFQRQTFSITDAQFELGENVATGALRIAFEDVPRLDGTLAFSALDLSPPAATAVLVEGTGPGAPSPTTQFATEWLSALNADIRISAGTVKAGAMDLSDTAASLILNNELLTIGLAQSTFYGGDLSGNITYRQADANGGAAISAQMRAVGFDVAGVASLLTDAGNYEGVATTTANVETAGSTLAELIGNLDGTTRFRAQNGSLPGVDLNKLARALAAGEPPPGIAAGDATAFDQLESDMVFGGHAALVEKTIITAANQETVFAGSIGLIDGRLDLSAFMRTGEANSLQFPFEMAGTIVQPTFIFARTN